jgi:hypothetical protein
MRERGARARRPAAGLHHHHRLGVGGGAQRAHEAARVLDAFQVDQDALRLAVVGQEVQGLRQVDGGVRAERDDGGEADAVVGRPVDDRRRERARLRHQPERSAGDQRAQAAGVEAERRALEAQRVGAQQLHAVALRGAVEFAALRRRQAAGQHDGGAAADAAHHLQRVGQLRRRQRDQREVGARVRQVRQRAGHADVQPRDLALERIVFQGLAQRACLRRRRLRLVGVAGEDDDRLRREQRTEDVTVHAASIGRAR